MANPAPTIDIYLGALPSEKSEREFLTRLQADLSRGVSDAVVLASFNVGPKSLQIDLVVATETTACVVEVKAYQLPVTGDLNGPWRQRLPDGATRSLGEKNPYMQAMDARFAIIDAMVVASGRTKEDVRRQITGLACAFPSLPPDSSIPEGDYKAYVGEYSRLMELLSERSTAPLSLADWRGLADRLGLEAFDQHTVSPEQRVIDGYWTQFQALRAARAKPNATPVMTSRGDTVEERDLLVRLREGRQFQIIGTTGSGKSHLLERIASACCDEGMVPIVLASHLFKSDLEPLLRKAVASSSSTSLKSFLSAAHSAGRPVILVVDALNECPTDRRDALIEALQAARLNIGASVVLSAQKETDLPLALKGETIMLSQPDRARAKLITELRLERQLTPEEENGLEIVTTANDAAVLAEVVQSPGAAGSRHALYQAFARRKLGDSPESPVAHSALAALATRMNDQFATSFPKAAALRIVTQNAHTRSHLGDIERLVERSGLLLEQDGHIRFSHDLVADFFAAENLLKTHVDPNALGNDVGRPIHRQLGEFVVGGCATTEEIATVLKAADQGNLLVSCLQGSCGARAREVVLANCQRLLDQLVERFTAVRFALNESSDSTQHFPGITENFDTCPPIDPELKAYRGLFASAVGFGLLPEIMTMLRKIDLHLREEGARLRQLHPEWKIRWEAEVLGHVFGSPAGSGDMTFHHVFQAARLIRWSKSNERGGEPYRLVVEALRQPTTLCVGELMFLIECLSGFDDYDGSPPENLYQIMEAGWSRRVYHLSLGSIDLGQRFGRRLEDSERERLGALMESWLSNSWPILNSSIFDVLQMLDYWEPYGDVEAAVEEYRRIIQSPITPELCDEALTSYIQLMDGPYQRVYGEAWSEHLNDAERNALLARAAGAHDRFTMFMSFVVSEVAEDPTPEAIPALLRHVSQPQIDTMSLQDSTSIFANAAGALARLGVSLGDLPPPQPGASAAWRKAAQLIHGFNLDEPPSDLSRVWDDLEDMGKYALDPIWRIDATVRHWLKVRVAFGDDFKDGLVRLCRRALKAGYEPVSIFDAKMRIRELAEDHAGYALSVIGQHGRSSDLAIVRPWLEHPKLGESALAAARAIELRSQTAQTE